MDIQEKHFALAQHRALPLLVFNDSRIDAQDVAEFLNVLGYQSVNVITDIRLLMHALEGRSFFCALVIDVRMPHLDGLTAIYQVRSRFSAAALPILAVTDAADTDTSHAAIFAGANDAIDRPLDPIATALRIRNLLTIQSLYADSQIGHSAMVREAVNQTARLNMLIENGQLISKNQDPQTQIHHTLFEGKRLLNCDAATLYAVTPRRTLRFAMRTRTDQVVESEIPLNDPQTGQANLMYVSTWCALNKKTVRVDNVYESDEFDFSGTRRYDAMTGYYTRSLLTAPLFVHGGEVIGVLQFINKLGPLRQIHPFAQDAVPLVEALAAMAAVSLQNFALGQMQLDADAHPEGQDSGIDSVFLGIQPASAFRHA
jgi:DNA-binding response OmpR family regulator